VREQDGQQYLQQWWRYQSERKAEQRFRDVFFKIGLLVSKPNDVVAVFEKSSEHVSPRIFGEFTPKVGRSLNTKYEGYDGIILIGPFNCLPFRISEAILKPLSIQQGMPLLTHETDAGAVSPAILRQVDVHIQQVLDHSAGVR
jgi:predicted nucleotide-binding protein (sugar kinase/HSP70/actin superfamily)